MRPQMRPQMRSVSRLMIVAAAVLALASCGDKNAGESAGDPAAPAGPARTLGKAAAPVKVVEYASMSCGHCAEFNNDEFPKFKAQYIDSGKVLYEMREILTLPTEVSAAGFLLAACSGKDKYFDTVDAIFHSLTTGGMADPRAGLLKVAADAGMSESAYDKCLNDEEALKALGARVEKNSAMATGTPTFYINDVKYEGPTTTEALGQAIEAATRK